MTPDTDKLVEYLRKAYRRGAVDAKIASDLFGVEGLAIFGRMVKLSDIMALLRELLDKSKDGITCPRCAGDKIVVVSVFCAVRTHKHHVGVWPLTADGFAWDKDGTHKDGSTENEVAQCSKCGYIGPLSDFGWPPELEEGVPDFPLDDPDLRFGLGEVTMTVIIDGSPVPDFGTVIEPHSSKLEYTGKGQCGEWYFQDSDTLDIVSLTPSEMQPSEAFQVFGAGDDWEAKWEETKKVLESRVGVTVLVDGQVVSDFGVAPPTEVTMIASGYEWTCPTCDQLNHEIEVVGKVQCRYCGASYEVTESIHADA